MPYTAQAFRARKLRNGMTEPEIWLWGRLKRLRSRGFHIRRQYPFRGYYLDFACLDRMVAVEIDGGGHTEDTQAEHDRIRDEVLERHGFQVLRFWNHEVREDIDRVMDVIVCALEARESRFWREPPEEEPWSPHPDRSAVCPSPEGEG
jgi:very-short-patch-repair endonuclease